MSTRRTDSAADPAWRITYDRFDSRDERRREALLALGNGAFVTRGTAADARLGPHQYPGTYRAGCYDRVESEIEGVHEDTDTLVNLPNWLPLVMRIEDGPWLRLGRAPVHDYLHLLDLRHGTSERSYTLQDEHGRRVRISERRFVSMADPYMAAQRLELAALGWSGCITICAMLDGCVENTNVRRYADYPHNHLEVHACRALAANEAALTARTRHTGIEIALAMRIACKPCTGTTRIEEEARIGQQFRVQATPGSSVVIDKTVALCSTQDVVAEAPLDRALGAVRSAGDFDCLHAAHAGAWQQLWSRAALHAEHPGLARSLRLHAFHILQTVSPHTVTLDAGVPARGWHGEGYRGHVFWDELFVLPFLNYRFPELAREALLYRYRRLDAARVAAREAGYRGAMYPWRSASDGREVTPRHQKNLLSGGWMPDHTHLQRHIGAAVAFNVWQHFLATGDAGFLADYGAEMMLEIARFWASIVRLRAADGRYEICGVIGPDEYHNAYPWRSGPGLDNNAYTNLMAAWTLQQAPRVLDHVSTARRGQLLHMLGLDESEFALWDRISRRMTIPFHDEGIISQFDGFEHLAEFDTAQLPKELADKRRDWALDAIGEKADDYQMTKQADALTLFYLFPLQEAFDLLARNGYRFDRSALRRSADYYLARTTHRSSLSRVVYAGALAEIDLARSWDFYLEALSTDLHALKGESTAEGIHLGAMGGTVDVLQRRYLGVHAALDGLHIDPMLPPNLGRVTLGLHFRGQQLELSAEGDSVRVGACPDNAQAVPLVFSGATQLLLPGGEICIELGGD